MAGLNPQVTNLIIILFFMQASKKIPFEDANVLNGIRVAYVLSNVAIAGIYLYVQMKVNAKKDRTTLKYVEPAAPGTQDGPKLVTTTVQQYDLTQLKKLFQGQAMGVAMMAFMHLYLKYSNPLVIQSIIPLKSAFESNLVKIHLLGHPASGELKRPFKAGGGLMASLGGQGEVKTDKASIEAAERAGTGGIKDE